MGFKTEEFPLSPSQFDPIRTGGAMATHSFPIIAASRMDKVFLRPIPLAQPILRKRETSEI